MVELRKINVENYQECLNLSVDESQSVFCESNDVSLAEAWVFPYASIPFAIYWNDRMVGFIMLSYDSEEEHYEIWRLMIDQRFQGKGLGRAAVQQAIDYLGREFRASEVYATVEADNKFAKQLYTRIGFKKIHETEEGEAVLRLIARN